MITTTDLYRAVVKAIDRAPNNEQKQVMAPGPSSPLFIVAGPGTGKTTSLALRILKLVLVDGAPPTGIVATTFTKKAAEELRSRVLGWGFKVVDALLDDPAISSTQKNWIRTVDINQVWTGTIDSLCEEVLRRYRAPGTQPPILADSFVSKSLMLRAGLFDQKRHDDPDLSSLLLNLHSSTGSSFGFYAGKKSELLEKFWERRHHDLITWPPFISKAPATEKAGRKKVDDALTSYANELSARMMVDFPMLEFEVLQRLQRGQLSEFTKGLRVILVDEYQDSNLMQEAIYFKLADSCKGALCVVGDDDQSLYRFRGATVDLFRDFPTRYAQTFGSKPTPVFLTFNYRSSKSIVNFVNEYAKLDADYQSVRVANKPILQPGPKAPQGLPVLGLFRNTPEELANDLARFIRRVFRGSGVTVDGHKIISTPKGGDIGDCALLCSSPGEYAASFGDKPPKERLPLLLRRELAQANPPINTFNPRGEDLADIPMVQRFGGLLLECLDPAGAIQAGITGISNEANTTMTVWRNTAINFAGSATAPKGLVAYATGWADRGAKRKGVKWPKSVPVIDLIYGLVHFLPELHDDPEGQIYLEVFTRQLAACTQLGSYGADVCHDPTNPGLDQASVRELLKDFLAPIAEGVVKISEELMETFPRDRLSVLSIHQAKGLEFPLTVVDIGSTFRTNNRMQAFKRYPQDSGVPHRMEDLLRPHSSLGTPTRSQLDRTFDDLYRQFFVAFSRPQDVLLLVGLTGAGPAGAIRNVASGWDRRGTSHWAGKKCPIKMI